MLQKGLIIYTEVFCLGCMEGSVRLVEGSSVSRGIVEICLNDSYGNICGDSWDSRDAIVTCRQLGFQTIGE